MRILHFIQTNIRLEREGCTMRLDKTGDTISVLDISELDADGNPAFRGQFEGENAFEEAMEFIAEWENDEAKQPVSPELEKRFDYVAHMAIEYAGLEKEGLRESRPRRLALVNAAAGFSALEMAYFCLQAVSHYSKGAFDNATMLTIFTNRLKQNLEDNS